MQKRQAGISYNIMKGSKKRIAVIFIISALFTVSAAALRISTALIEPDAHIYPDYPMLDLGPVLSKETFSENDYITLYYQTGLARPAIDEIRKSGSGWEQCILSFQDSFFREIMFVCEKNSPISWEESIIDENGSYINGTQVAPLHEGDILLTKSSHTYGWRNGHSALVIDAAKGLTLESVVLGKNSSIQDISKWTNYPNFILLRPKDIPYEQMRDIARTAQELLLDVPYDLTAGIFGPKSAGRDKVTGTHCSHLVWQAYSYYGYDLDSDGGAIVTPNDIANSPLLEVVQVYGVDPANIWS
jgi:uncharacterized protein YycO